jgi:organic radical activating enzyme
MANKNIFCAVPWYNSHLYWDGSYGACCSEIIKPIGPVKNINETSIVTWYNSEAMRNFRSRILRDEKLPECAACYKEEKYGHESRRIRENYKVAIFTQQAFEKSYRQSPWYNEFELSKNNDGTTSKLPIDLHIDFGNECNLACKMCSPYASSKIAQQYTKWNIDFDKKRNWTDSNDLFEKFLNNITITPNLNRIHVMGGEPVINKRFHEFVDWLIGKNFKNISLSFVSNGTFFNDTLIDKLKFFKSVDIEISLESIHRNNDYIRQGSDTGQILNNIEKLLTHQSSNFSIVLRSVPQLLSVNNYDDYILFALDKKISIQSIPLTSPDYLSITVLPRELRTNLIPKYQKLKEKINSNFDNIKTITTGRDVSRLEHQLLHECNTIINILEQPEPQNVGELRTQLIDWLIKWDQVFHLNALEIFPEYNKFLIDNGYVL